jgi:hypothetical protein
MFFSSNLVKDLEKTSPNINNKKKLLILVLLTIKKILIIENNKIYKF